MKIISIIITYNGAKLIRKCLDSLKSGSLKTGIVVVDNNSSDSTKEIIKVEYPEVLLMEQDQNLGFGRANNIGLCYALDHGADLIFLINQDAWIEYNALEILVCCAADHPEYGVISPMHLDRIGRDFDFGFSQYFAAARDYGADRFFSREKPLYDVPKVNAAMWLVSRRCLEQAGGFDPLFFHYGEDEDYCNRVRFHGFKVGVCPRSIGYHDRGHSGIPSSDKFRDQVLRLRLAMEVQLKDLNRNFAEAGVKEFGKMLFSIFGNIGRVREAMVRIYVFGMVLIELDKISRSRKKCRQGSRVYL